MKRKRKEVAAEPNPAEWEARSLERFKPLLNAEEFKQLVEEIRSPLPLTFRYNPLKTTRETLLGLANRYHWSLEPIPFCPTGFRVSELEGAIAVSQTLEHKMGHYYIQEAASMLPVELFRMSAAEPELCLDLAASPGGKTTHLVSRGEDRSLVFANDSSAGRIQALRVVLQNWGAVNTVVTQFPGEKFGSWFAGTFDRVLIDAPCSMQGLRTAESHDVRPVTDREISSLSRRQENLLASALQAVKVGGEVVYSTCTLVPEEDEAVIDAVLKRFGGKVEVVQTNMHAPGVASAGGQAFDPEVQKSIRLWPNRFHTAGFFACLLRKTGNLDLPVASPPYRPLERTGFSPLRAKEVRELESNLLDAYGFDLAKELEHYRLDLVAYGSRIYAFPERMLAEFSGLPVQSTGLLVGEQTADGFVPAHEWVSRFFSSFSANRFVVPEEWIDAWMRGENLTELAVSQEYAGSILVMVDSDGRYLGRGKVSGERIKNLLPHRLV